MALLTLRLLKIGFTASQEHNNKQVFFKNDKGNTIYVFQDKDHFDINVFKVSKSCLHKVIKNSELRIYDEYHEMEYLLISNIISEIKLKLKLTKDIF